MKFLRNFLASLLALFVFTVGGFILFILIASLFGGSKTVQVEPNSILKLELNKPLADLDFEDPLSDIPFSQGNINRIGIVDVKRALRHAREDDNIKGLVLSAPALKGGFAYGEELREALVDFKTSGKFILSYADLLTEGGYYLSSVADELYMSPQGSMEWNGLSVEMTFYKGAFDKLEIEPQIFRVGEYKSAVEPFITDKMSDANREQIASLITSVYNRMINEVSENVKPTANELHEYSEKLVIRKAQDAVDYGLITGLKYKDEFNKIIAEKVDVDDPQDIEFIEYQDYNKSFSDSKVSKNKIAVIIANGEIVNAKPEEGIITATQFVKELRKARENDRVKAVVFRINSPGGDALVSDLIWREVAETRKIKPVIASFANYAASGGYYIGMAADTIVSQPNTITGSIGIFAIIFNIGDFMSHKLGITTDYVNTGDYSGMWTSSRSLSDAEKDIIQTSVNDFYELFTSKAAAGRGMEIDELKKVASGRVWTGTQAKEIGLVDILGNLHDAIEIAAAKAGVQDDYQVRFYPKRKNSIEQLIEQISGSVEAKATKEKMGDLYPYFNLLKKVRSLHGLQARLPYDMVIR